MKPDPDKTILNKLKNKQSLVYFIILIVAIALRLPSLSLRPMHGDEAVNAVKYSELLEKGQYFYDPQEYHGPTLFYLTLPVSWLAGQSTFQELSESSLRFVPLLFCIGLLLSLLLLRGYLGWNIVIFSALFLAISPAFVFYSRYFIHEILFIFFGYSALFAAYRYFRKGTLAYLFMSAVMFAFMVATKETWIIFLFSWMTAIFLIVLFHKNQREKIFDFVKGFPISHLIYFTVIFFVVVYLLFTSFFQNPNGFFEAISAFKVYLHRADNSPFHLHPWYRYFQWLFFNWGKDYFWSEVAIAIFSVFGFVSTFKLDDQNPAYLYKRFFAYFTFTMLIVFSAIPYKTPWNLLGFWFAAIVMAGFGVEYILQNVKSFRLKMVTYFFILGTVLHLSWQSYQLNYVHYSTQNNPYVYAHPVEDVIKLSERMHKIAQAQVDGYNMHIQIIAKDNDYWPLPWYLRHFKRIGWWNQVDTSAASAPVIITTPELENDLIYKLYKIPPPGNRLLYLPLFEKYIELRNGVELRVYITKELWDKINS